jgi:uncharacterized membrane protein
VGESEFAAVPMAAYGVVLLLAAMAYFLLTRALVSLHGSDSALAVAVGSDVKGKVSLLLYALAVPLAFAVYVLVALMWLAPDRRIEKALAGRP